MGNAGTKSTYPKSLGANSRRVYWAGPGLPAPPGKPILVPGTEDTQPDVVGIRWERSPSNGGSAIIGYLVEHRRLGSPHWVRSAPVLCAFPELTLSGLEPGWRYQFRVRAQNALGLSQPSELSDPLTVTLQRSAACAPRFELELKDTVALENEQVEFVVRFIGTPLPKISWFKDGFEIFSSRRTRIVTENGKSTLLIHQTALNDEGEIKCTATNRAGHVGTKAKLLLEAPPRIRLPRQYEDGLLFEQDETIRLKVSLAGRPAPTVTWYHDGEPVPKDNRHVFETMDGESVLKIPDAKRNDRGEYTVKATNKLGEDISSFLVTVTDRPAAPGKATVTMTLGRSVTLSWKEPEDDGGCKIGTYIVEYYRIGWDVWLKAVTCRQTTTTLSELIEGSEYKFRVKAENPYGVSDPSDESEVVFVPDLKRGITSPPLRGKSQSHREISRSRPERREVSFTEPAQRTRSLTREETRLRESETNGRFDPTERSVSTQRLSAPTRPSRADSRVTFALDTTVYGEQSEPPIPPARSRDRDLNRSNQINQENAMQKDERPTSPKPVATVTISPPPDDNVNEEPIFRGPRARSVSIPRERSPSPPSTLRILSNRKEELPIGSARQLRPSTSLILKKQDAVTEDHLTSTISLGSPNSPREDDEIALHGSSEFMLVLYPEGEDFPDQGEPNVKLDVNEDAEKIENNHADQKEDEEDLVPPPMSLSLPELFSADHEIIETLREAVSSTELLHERAMERFYKAVAAEEATEKAKRAELLERQVGELATSTRANRTLQQTDLADQEQETDAAVRRLSLRRRLSNSGSTAQSLLSSWQAKKNRRRSSEGQTDGGLRLPTKLLQPVLLADVEARSDPNLPSEGENSTEQIWRRGNEEEAAVERLRRWHENNVSLVEEEQTDRSIPVKLSANEEARQVEGDATDQQVTQQRENDAREELGSVETSVESSEEDISSADSEDLKLLKARIMARQVMEEEDTYHPRGRPVLHVDTEPPPIPPHRLPIGDSSSPLISPPPSPSPSPMPKSILKKRVEEPVPLNSFGRPIPPEKPIRKQPPLSPEPTTEVVSSRDKSYTDLSESMRTPAMSESDTDSILSAAEAAKSRRIQAKQRSVTPDEEENEADVEARMAMVNHYTEIVREYSSQHGYRSSEERKFTDAKSTGSRRSSVSEDQDQRNHIGSNRIEAKTNSKPQIEDSRKSRQKDRSNVDRLERQDSQPPGSRGNSVGPRGIPPTVDAKPAKETRRSRPSSRNQSPASRSRNVSTERGGASSRSSSKTRTRAPSRERSNRTPARAVTTETDRSSRERSVEGSRRRSTRSTSRPTSRSSSRDRPRTTTPTEVKMERLQRALDSKRYRTLRRDSNAKTFEVGRNAIDPRLEVEAKKNVRSTVSYVTDVTLLLAAIYIYLFKKEILAVPFIALLLYRRIQQEVHGRLTRRWWQPRRNQ